MDKKFWIIPFAALSLCGCATSFRTTGEKGELPGIPIATPVVTKLTAITSFKPLPSFEKFSVYCGDQETVESIQVLPLGEIYYLNVKAPPFGKTDFTLELYDSGALNKLVLNLDSGTNIKGLLDTALPYIKAAKQPEAQTAAPGALSSTDDAMLTAAQKKAKYCVSADTKITTEVLGPLKLRSK